MLNVTKRDFSIKRQSFAVYKNTVESGLNLSADNLDKIISVGGFVAEPSCLVDGGFVCLGGKAYFSVVFMGEEVERLEVGVKFDYKRAVSDTPTGASAQYYLTDIAVKEDGGMLYISAELNTEVTFNYAEPQKVVVGGNLLLKPLEAFYDEVYSCRATYNGEEEIERSKIKKVIASSVNACVTRVKARADQLVVEGQAYINLALLPVAVGADIIKERLSVPFTFEMECVGAKEGDIGFAECAVKGQTVKVLNLEESADSQISICFSLDITGNAVRAVKQTCVSDAFSCEFDLDKQFKDISTTRLLGQRCVQEKVFGRAICQVPEYSRLVVTLNESVIVTETDFSGNELVIRGVVSADCVFNGDNGYESKRAEMPFEVKLEKTGDVINNLRVVIESLSAKLKSGRIELDISLKVCFNESTIVVATVIEDIVQGEQKSPNKSVISVYMAKKGDTEWDVMCATGESKEVILKNNPQLAFPLLGTEKIIIFRNAHA